MPGPGGDPRARQVVVRGMSAKNTQNAKHAKNAVKRGLTALALSTGALGLAAGAAHADGTSLQAAAPLAKRVGDIVDHPGQAVQDTKTALAVTGAAADSATKSTSASLAGAGGALQTLPQGPAVK
ncbi:hypothetical protein C0216_28080 [Streptomyces globosus]|uniref:Uncharacterized protein n=2 Tax=Streptomyces TaxID=1883 RepID=A0A344U7A5_9ACTN|nr:hypothetical protein C0216_28080 [Streptomyces globosus]